MKLYQAYLHLIRKTGITKKHIRFYLLAAYLKRMEKYIKRPPFYKVQSSYQKKHGMSK